MAVRPEKFNRLIEAAGTPYLLRGEVWVSPEVLSAAGFNATPGGLIDFTRSLGGDICFFHWPESGRSYGGKELADRAHAAGLICGVTADGPFQRIASAGNLPDVLREVARDPAGFGRLLAARMEEITGMLPLLEEANVELFLIADDVGYAGGPYFSPEVFRTYLAPLYRGLASRLAACGIAPGWHSDGDVALLLPDLVKCGFRFFSLEPECVDLVHFKRTYGSRVSLISGIRSDWLAAETVDQQRQREFLREINALAGEGGLILASSCGLYRSGFLANLRMLYRLIEDRPSPFPDRFAEKPGPASPVDASR